MGNLGGFEELFLPSARHQEDERNRLEWTRDEEGQGDPFHGPIDLDSGTVQMRATAPGDPDDPDDRPPEADDRPQPGDRPEPGDRARPPDRIPADPPASP